jgi:hypothetical protein
MEGTCIHSIYNSLTEGIHTCKKQCLLLCFPEKLQQKQSQSHTNLSTLPTQEVTMKMTMMMMMMMITAMTTLMTMETINKMKLV